MSGEEDDKELELKDLIVQTLESNGLLAKIKVIQIFTAAHKEKFFVFFFNPFFFAQNKAQIRASVFTALDDNDKKNAVISTVSKFFYEINFISKLMIFILF